MDSLDLALSLVLLCWRLCFVTLGNRKFEVALV